MNARERAEAWYHGYDADDKGELLEGLAAQFEAAERDAWNAAIEAVAQVCKKEAETSDWQECAALLDMSGEILKLRK